MQSRTSSAKSASGSIFVQDTANVNNLFSSSRVYNKGAYVLQMLRLTLGDSLFFAGIRSYADDPSLRFSSAATADLQRNVEAVSHRDLTWFFNEWIYGQKYPKYSYSYATTPGAQGFVTDLNIRQTTGTTTPAFFIMTIPLKAIAAGWDTTVYVDNNLANQTFQIAFSHKPDTIQFDPEGWILCDKTKVVSDVLQSFSVPKAFSLEANYPNPFNPSTSIRYTLPEPCHVKLTILNILGQQIAQLVNEEQGSGEREVNWNAAAASGMYYYRLETMRDGINVFSETRKMVLLR
jgi:hypothetical protein